MEASNKVRDYVRREFIEPARGRKQSTVTVVVGDVHKALGFNQRVPLVCQALSGKKFLEENHLTLEKREGPKSGFGTRVTFTYRLAEGDRWTQRPGPASRSSFVALRGIARDLFRDLGGGEAFIRKERESFYGDKKPR